MASFPALMPSELALSSCPGKGEGEIWTSPWPQVAVEVTHIRLFLVVVIVSSPTSLPSTQTSLLFPSLHHILAHCSPQDPWTSLLRPN